MQGLLRGTAFLLALGLSAPLGAQQSPVSPSASALPETAWMRQRLAATLGSDFEVIHTELHAGLSTRAGTFWLAHVRPLRSGDYAFRYVREYHDRFRPDDPMYTHVEHATRFSVGERECLRRAERRLACVGDVIVIPVVAGDGRGPLGGHVFEASRRGDAGTWGATVKPAPRDDRAATARNPAAPHLRYLGVSLEEMPHRAIGETVEVSAAFEAGAPGALELSVGGVTVPVVIVERGVPVTVLLDQEQTRAFHRDGPFASHTGDWYPTDVLLLQPGDRIDVQILSRSIHGSGFTEEEREAFRRTPEIAVGPFRMDRARRFNAFLADHLPATR